MSIHFSFVEWRIRLCAESGHLVEKKKTTKNILGNFCFAFFFNLRDYLFPDWALAFFLFSISELIHDKLVLNRNKWCHFTKWAVCVSAIPLPRCLPPLWSFDVPLSLFSVHLVLLLCLTWSYPPSLEEVQYFNFCLYLRLLKATP